MSNLRDSGIGFKVLACCNRVTRVLPSSYSRAHTTIHLSGTVASKYLVIITMCYYYYDYYYVILPV